MRNCWVSCVRYDERCNSRPRRIDGQVQNKRVDVSHAISRMYKCISKCSERSERIKKQRIGAEISY